MISEGLALIDKAMRHRRPGRIKSKPRSLALHARAARAEETDWAEIDVLYAALERHTPSPVVTLNRAVRVSKRKGPEAALALIAPLADRLDGYFYFHGVRGAFAEAARAQRRSARSVQPRDRARQHAGGSGAYSAAISIQPDR